MQGVPALLERSRVLAAGRLERVLVVLATLAALAVGVGVVAARPAAAGQAAVPTLVVAPAAVARFSDDFNPFAASTPAVRSGITSYIYEPLIEYDGAQVDQYYPWLAAGWSFSSTGQTVTFAIRSGVRWADGSPLVAADAAYTYNLVKQYPSLAPGLPVVSATATGPLTFALTLSSPAYTHLEQIASVPIVKAGYGRGSVQGFVDRHPDGTGPYELARGGFSSHRVVLSARAGYWQKGAPAIGRLVFPAFSSVARLRSALVSGTLDWAGTFMPDVASKFAAHDLADNHYWLTPRSTVALDLNLERAPTASLAVRSAISAALDRRQVSVAVSGGNDPPATSASGLVMPMGAGLLDRAAATDLAPGADLAAAGHALVSAGYHLGPKGLWVDRSGAPLQLSLVAQAGTGLATAGRAVTTQLRSAGFAASFRALDGSAWRRALAGGYFDAAVVEGAPGPDPYPMYEQWLDPALLHGPVASGGDYGRLGPTTLPSAARTVSRALAALASSPPGSPGAASAVRSIAAVVSSQRLVVPIMYTVAWGEFSTRHATGWPGNEDPYEPASPAAPFAEYTVLQLSPAG